MPRETQQSIRAWALETFGESTPLVIASRCNVELAELVSAIVHEASPDSIRGELADVQIVLDQVAEHFRFDLTRVDQPEPLKSVVDKRHAVTASRLQASFGRLLTELALDRMMDVSVCTHYVREQLEDVQQLLWQLCDHYGVCIDIEVDKKMEINRARVWSKNAAGRFQHIPDFLTSDVVAAI